MPSLPPPAPQVGFRQRLVSLFPRQAYLPSLLLTPVGRSAPWPSLLEEETYSYEVSLSDAPQSETVTIAVSSSSRCSVEAGGNLLFTVSNFDQKQA